MATTTWHKHHAIKTNKISNGNYALVRLSDAGNENVGKVYRTPASVFAPGRKGTVWVARSAETGTLHSCGGQGHSTKAAAIRELCEFEFGPENN